MKTSPRSSTEPALVACLVLAALGALAPPLAAGGELREKARAALADPRFQTYLPTGADEPSRARAAGPDAANPAPANVPDASPSVEIPAPEGLATLGWVALWVLAAAALGLAVLGWVNRSAQRRAEPVDATRSANTSSSPPETEVRDSPTATPDDLAARELYGEAAHALLLQASVLLAGRFRIAVPPSRTSRELLAALPLQGAAREAFAGLVASVERWWFGDSPVGAVEYRLCLARFHLALGAGGRND